MKAKLTKRFIENLAAEGSRDLWVWDTELPGFGVRVKPSGVKAYVLQYRNMRVNAGVKTHHSPEQKYTTVAE